MPETDMAVFVLNGYFGLRPFAKNSCRY